MTDQDKLLETIQLIGTRPGSSGYTVDIRHLAAEMGWNAPRTRYQLRSLIESGHLRYSHPNSLEEHIFLSEPEANTPIRLHPTGRPLSAASLEGRSRHFSIDSHRVKALDHACFLLGDPTEHSDSIQDYADAVMALAVFLVAGDDDE